MAYGLGDLDAVYGLDGEGVELTDESEERLLLDSVESQRLLAPGYLLYCGDWL